MSLSFKSVLMLLAFCCAAPLSAHAQDNTEPLIETVTPQIKTAPPLFEDAESGDFMSVPYYDMLVRQAIQQRPKNFEFGTLRQYYTETPQYDPLGEMTRKRMVSLAYKMENEPDPAARKEAFEEYGALLSAHLANIDVVSQALVLSEGDKLYGDPGFFIWMRAGLLRDIANSGDGRSLLRAYDVVTLGEETTLIKVLRLRVLKTEPGEEAGVHYNMHQVKDPAYAEPYWMFVNTTKPIKALEKQERSKKRFSLQRK